MRSIQAHRTGANPLNAGQIITNVSRMVSKALIGGMLGALLLGSLANSPVQAQAPDAQDKNNPKVAAMSSDEVISQTQPIKAGFVINVVVTGENEPSGTFQVDAAGNIAIKYDKTTAPIKVIGKTPTEVTALITTYLKTYLKEPKVTVTIVGVPRPVIFIGGAVRVSGPLSIGSEVTLIDVLSRAEILENADLSRVVIYRHPEGSDKSTVLTYNFEKYFRPAPGEMPDETQNPTLKDKDRIVVPAKNRPGQGTVSVFGEVEKTQRDIPLPPTQSLTIREAINLVGGARASANRKAVIVRRVGEDRPLVIDLDKAEQGDLVNNISLHPDDTVYVEKLENNAYVNVIGGVVKPGKLVYDKRTTLTQALSESGGLAPGAKEKEGVIFRHPDGDAKHTQTINFNFQSISKGKAPDIELQPGDSVVIPSTIPSPRPPRDFLDILQAVSGIGYLIRYF